MNTWYLFNWTNPNKNDDHLRSHPKNIFSCCGPSDRSSPRFSVTGETAARGAVPVPGKPVPPGPLPRTPCTSPARAAGEHRAAIAGEVALPRKGNCLKAHLAKGFSSSPGGQMLTLPKRALLTFYRGGPCGAEPLSERMTSHLFPKHVVPQMLYILNYNWDGKLC